MTYFDELVNKPGMLPIVQPNRTIVAVPYRALLLADLISDTGMVASWIGVMINLGAWQAHLDSG